MQSGYGPGGPSPSQQWQSFPQPPSAYGQQTYQSNHGRPSDQQPGSRYSGADVYPYQDFGAGPPPPPAYNVPTPPAQNQWANTSQPGPHYSQPWQSSAPPPNAPSASQVSAPVYNPNTYGAMPGARPPPVGPVQFDGAQGSDTSNWGVRYNQQHVHAPSHEPKPPLPPRPSSVAQPAQNQPVPDPAQRQYSTQSPTQDSNPNQEHYSYSVPLSNQVQTSDFQYRPPPPPPKLPQDYQNEHQHHRYDQQLHQQQSLYSNQPIAQHYYPSVQQQTQYFQAPTESQYHVSTYNVPAPSLHSQFSNSSYSVTAPPSNYQVQVQNIPVQPSHSPPMAETSTSRIDHQSNWTSVVAQPFSPIVSPTQPEHSVLAYHHGSQSLSPTSTPLPQRDTSPLNRESQLVQGHHVPIAPSSTQRSSIHGNYSRQICNNCGSLKLNPTTCEYCGNAGGGHEYMREHAATSPPNNQSIQKYQHVNPSQAHESTQQHGSPQASHAAAENQVGTPDVKPVVSPVGILSAKAALGASDVSAASALGYGGPSDWEHFGSSVADEVDDTELFSRKGNPAQMIANDNVELLSQPAPSRPENKDSQSSPFFAELEQGTPSSAHLPLQPHLGPLPTSPSVAQNNSAPLFAATSAATPPSDNQLAPERSGPIERVGDSASGSPAQSQYQTIDEAIHIWSEPSKVSTKEGSLEQIAPGMAKQSDAVEYENHSPQQPSGQLETLDPPRPEGLVHSSMQHTTKNETRSEERQVGVIEEVGASGLVQQHLPVRDSSKANPLEHIVDLAHQRAHDSEDAYSDLDPWAKASLNRYTGMLRAEASATTDASKLQIFEAFMAKESLLRAVLYGASPEITFNTITRLGQPSSSVTKPADLDRHTEDGRTTASPQAEPRPSTPANAPSQQRATPLSPPKEQSASVETGNSCVRTPSPMANPAVPQGEPLTHLVEVPLLNDISRPEQPKMPLSPQIQEQSTSRREKSTSPIEAVPLEKQPALQGHFLTTVAVPSSAQSSETDLREEEQPTLKLATTGSYAETNLEDDIQYSPGGRPIVPRPDREQPRDQKVAAQSSQHPVSHQQVTKRECGGQKYDGRPSSPGADAPIVVTATWDNTSARLPRSTSVPPGLDSGVQRSSSQGYQEVATTRPAYTPFRYIQDSSPDSGHPSSSQSYYKAYSAPRQTSVDSGMSLRNKSAIQTRRGTLDSASASRREHNDTLVENRKVFWDSGKIINGKTNLPEVNENIPESQATILGGRPGSPRTAFQHPGAHEVSTVHEAIATLKRTLPASRGQVPTLANNPQVDAAKHDVDNVHDDFTFIKKTVVAWDAEAKKIRALHEKERRVRQEQSEERIDGLFHDDEIGYSDIGVLEAEFKTAEAEKRALEEEEEQNSFLRSVFHVVTNKIQEEIDHLSGQYNMLMSLLIHAVTCKTTLDLDEDRPEITQVLEVILIIHSKLEIRHKKIFEALLEKDRRSRKTRLAPLYTEGRITEMKQLEKEYEKIEREATLEAARKRDGRANELIEAIDEHTIRGIKENQDCIRVLSREIRTIDEAISVGSRIDDLNELHADLTFARTLLTYLLANSTRLMQQSHSADGILNDADYDVSVAEARLANADAKTFERLGEEKDGEDAKLKVELEQRCSTVKEDFGVADQLADALIARLKDVDSEDKGRVGTPVPGHSDPEHEDRIKRALDEAKKRNADKQAGFEIMS